MSSNVEDSERPSKDVRDAFRDAKNVTGGEFKAPYDLDGYLDEPKAEFGLWVGENSDDAELVTFELDADQVEGFAEVFARMADDVETLREGDDG